MIMAPFNVPGVAFVRSDGLWECLLCTDECPQTAECLYADPEDLDRFCECEDCGCESKCCAEFAVLRHIRRNHAFDSSGYCPCGHSVMDSLEAADAAVALSQMKANSAPLF